MKYGGGLVIFLLLIKAMSLEAMESGALLALKPANDVTTLLETLDEDIQVLDEFLMEIPNQRGQEAIAHVPAQTNLAAKNEQVPPHEESSSIKISVFKQQLLYRNRLPVKIAKQSVVTDKAPKQFRVVAEVVIVEPISEMSRLALNTMVTDLVGVIGKTFETVKSSGWILKAESDFYILNPLHLAIKHGLVDCAKLLLSEGVDAKALDHLGRPPLHMVALLDDERLQQKLVPLLLFYHALIDAPNKSGDTALTIAVQQGKDRFVDLLLYLGADPNINVQAESSGQKDAHASGTSPLWTAVSGNRAVAAASLLKKKAEIKSAERDAAQQMYDTTQDESHKLLLAEVLAISHH